MHVCAPRPQIRYNRSDRSVADARCDRPHSIGRIVKDAQDNKRDRIEPFGATEIVHDGWDEQDGERERTEVTTEHQAQECEGYPLASKGTDDRGKCGPMPTNDETQCFANSVVEVAKSASETDERVDAE